ncbi:MAG: response regulator transcription factor [Bacteroides sp.]|nr:response regulator transcription factor [Bacteroides sp.]MBQ8224344.1 response regulator transcription factor [Bacteroides sp.]
MTSFILADNQDITRAGLQHYICQLFPEASIVNVTCKRELMTALKEHENGIVVMDYTLFDLQGTDELLIIGKRFPQSRWLLFSHELSENSIRQLSAEPSISLILKECSCEEIFMALKCATQGERYLCHQISNLLLTHPTKQPSILTTTEVEILKLIAHGKSVKEIAALRVSSIHTIITHKKNIFRKLEVNNVYEATRYALRAGLIELVEYYI